MVQWTIKANCPTSAMQEMAEAAQALFGRSRQFIDLSPNEPPPVDTLQGKTDAVRRLPDGLGTTVALIMLLVAATALRAMKPLHRKYRFKAPRTYRHSRQKYIADATVSRRDDAPLLCQLPVDSLVDRQGVFIGRPKGAPGWRARDRQTLPPHLQEMAGSTPPPR